MLANLALLVSSIVQASIRNLSLYTAILISYLLILHLTSASTVLILRASQGQKVHRRYTPFLVLQSILILALAIYIWCHVHTFGSQPECNSATRLIFFGHAFSTTGSGRIAPIGAYDQRFFRSPTNLLQKCFWPSCWRLLLLRLLEAS